MLTFNDIATFAYESEYETAYDLSTKKPFSNPKIYTAKGDLSKRWYVYFSFRDPKTNKLKRLPPFYGKANTFKTKEERLEVLTAIRRVLLKMLKRGFSPFENNQDLIKDYESNIKTKSKEENLANGVPSSQNASEVDINTENKLTLEKSSDSESKELESDVQKMTISSALSFALNYKEHLVSTTTIKGYKNRVDIFVKWLNEKYPKLKYIEDLNKKIAFEFLNDVLAKSSARNRNNYRTELSSIIQVLEDNDIIPINFIKKIPVLKTVPKRNKSYDAETQEAIFKYLEEKNTTLLLFIKFIAFGFLRPIEICRLKVGDIDVTNRTMQFKAKNSPLKTKIIPKRLLVELPDLSNLNSEDYLFSQDNLGGTWNTDLNNKRNFYSKRFKQVVKTKFNLGEDYGLYSFRHTYVTRLYRKMTKNLTPFEAKSKLMLITGHSTMSALEKYLRDIDAELPEDFSDML